MSDLKPVGLGNQIAGVPLRFLADENVSREVTTRLRHAGIDVLEISNDRRGSIDQLVLEIATSDKRILITEDRDFGELVIRQRLPVEGVLLLELDQLSNIAEADRVLQVVTGLGEKLRGNLVVAEPSRTRVRPLAAQG